jgi:hypothetical protein|tara:strand:+ start:829 stop:1671 length:843 start_codon:yes stop_codon:yes gene_type:complete
MDWQNESYIRLYVRDTMTWHLLGWNGQAVLAQVLRKMDLSGVMDIGDREPWEAVVAHCRAPVDAAKEGIEKCLELGVFQHNTDAGQLVAPNFREAQEAVKSDKLRQKESRARRRLTAMSQNVMVEAQSVIVESRSVTNGHDRPQLPTNGHERSPNALRDGAVRDDAVRCVAGAGDPILSFAKAWRELTGRHEFKEYMAMGMVGGTERQALADFQKACDGSVAEFRARVSARLEGDRNNFNLEQSLVRWSTDLINVPVKAPSTEKSFRERWLEERENPVDH